MSTLFEASIEDTRKPLADRVRPRDFACYRGQEKVIGLGTPLRRLVEQDRVPSLMLWGPPGTGKTTLARIIAELTKAKFVELSAVMAGVADIRLIMQQAEDRWLARQERTLVFIDEIHRFNKGQQDALLPYVERGTVSLIGATTENPSFALNAALLSRSRVFVLERLSDEDVRAILERALVDDQGYVGQTILIPEEVMAELVRVADGDARRGLNALESAVEASRDEGGAAMLTLDGLREVLQRTHFVYDKNGDAHYDLISALHKSLRGSDVQASIYWCMRMLESGEDPLYVARRLVRFASEDVGMKDPRALIQAMSTFHACQAIGMPECNVILVQLVVYLAKAPKSNACYKAVHAAKDAIHRLPSLPVPLHIRNAPTKLMKDLGHGKGYKYPPDGEGQQQTYLPKELQDLKFYEE